MPTCALLCPWQCIGIRMWGYVNLLVASMCVHFPPGGEASGPGQTSVTQHSQEADRLPAGSAGRRGGEEICQVTVCECSRPSPPLTSTCCSVRWCGETLLKLCDVAPLCFQKKLPLTILAQCLVEGAAVLGDDSLLGWGTSPKYTPSTHTHTHSNQHRLRHLLIWLLNSSLSSFTLVCVPTALDRLRIWPNRKMLKLCGETEEKLAQELIQFENQIERDVVEPLYVLAEVSADNVQYSTTTVQ